MLDTVQERFETFYFSGFELVPVERELSVVEGQSTVFGLMIISDVTLQRSVVINIEVAESTGKHGAPLSSVMFILTFQSLICQPMSSPLMEMAQIPQQHLLHLTMERLKIWKTLSSTSCQWIQL